MRGLHTHSSRQIGVGTDHEPTPTRLLAGNNGAAVLRSCLVIGTPDRLEQISTTAEHDRLAAIPSPEPSGACRPGKARIDLGVRRLRRRWWCDAGLGDVHVGIDTQAVGAVHVVHVRISVEVRKRKELAVIAERFLVQCRNDDVDVFFEALAIQVVGIGVLVPRPDRTDLVEQLEVLNPPGLLAADQTNQKLALMRVVQRRDVLSDSQRVVGPRDETARQDLHLLAELAQIHRYQARIVRYLESLDLQMVFEMTQRRIAAGVGSAHQIGQLAEHALIQIVAKPGPAGLELSAPADHGIDQNPSIQHRTGATLTRNQIPSGPRIWSARKPAATILADSCGPIADCNDATEARTST